MLTKLNNYSLPLNAIHRSGGNICGIFDVII